MNNFLYIGLNGFAGSGKDSVAKMLKVMLAYNWPSMSECWDYFNSVYNRIDIPATFNNYNKEQTNTMLIAFADQLKYICSAIFGIPVDRFYSNKETAWICINKDFKYTEAKPEADNIITADEYYYRIADLQDASAKDYYMSLREILVYIGTYVLQYSLNNNVFINVIKNKVAAEARTNKKLNYIICTDVRFEHEFKFIKESNGITIKIVRDNVKQMKNIAEHNLDDEDNYNYIIENNGTYEELFETVWNMIHDNAEFNNDVVKLLVREDNANNYLRVINKDNNYTTYKLCTSTDIGKITRNNGFITSIDPIGGPTIYSKEVLEIENGKYVYVNSIIFNEDDLTYHIVVDNKYLDNMPTIY